MAEKKQKTYDRTILVFVASDQNVYGDLIWNIAQTFIADFKKSNTEAIVIGKIGRALLEKAKVESDRIYYYDLADDRPDLRILDKIVEILEKYDRVIVYYGKTESLLKQIPVRSEVLKEIPDIVKPTKKYIFEPTSDEVLDLLQLQASMNSFHQKVYEAQYAKLAAKRWNWTKQQMARSRLLEELTREFLKYKKSLGQKQQQVAIFAHRKRVLDNPNIRGAAIYGA